MLTMSFQSLTLHNNNSYDIFRLLEPQSLVPFPSESVVVRARLPTGACRCRHERLDSPYPWSLPGAPTVVRIQHSLFTRSNSTTASTQGKLIFGLP